MKNRKTIKAGKFLQMIKDSRLKDDYPQIYEKYYVLIEAHLSDFPDYTLDGLSSLKGLAQKAEFDSFLEFDSLRNESTDIKEKEVDNKSSAILAEVTTWHSQQVDRLQSVERLRQNGDAVKKKFDGETTSLWVLIVSAIFTIALGAIASHFKIEHDIIEFWLAVGGAIIAIIITAIAGICNIILRKKFRSEYDVSISNARKLFPDDECETEIGDKGYEAEIRRAINLCGTQARPGTGRAVRKAKRIFNNALDRNAKDVNGLVGLLRIASKNFTRYNGSLIDKYINDIEKYREDDKKLIDGEYDDYIKKKEERSETEKTATADREQNRRKRKEKRHEYFAKIGVYTILILPIVLSVAVIVLTYCLPVRSFDNYTGWLFTIVFALDCLSALVFVVVWIVLAINFDGLGVGGAGALLCVAGALVGLLGSVNVLFQWAELWATILFFVLCVIYVIVLIAGLVDDADVKSIPRYLLVGIIGISCVWAMYCGGFSFHNNPYRKNSDGTYTYVLCDENTVNLEIRAEYCGKPVTGIARGVDTDLGRLKSIVIPDSVTRIDYGVLSGCSGLISLTVPYVGYHNASTVTGYDGEAETLDPIGYLFGCSSYDGGVATTQVHWGKYTSGKRAGEESRFNNTYYIPASLKNVTVLGGEVCDGAFYGCTNLGNVTLGDGITAINEDAFTDCGAVRQTKGLSYVDKWVVACSSTVTNAEISGDTVGIADSAFAKAKITSLTIPQSVSFIGAKAFNTKTLATVVFENNEEWYADGTYMPSSVLMDSTKAAKYLTSTYVSYRWKRG